MTHDAANCQRRGADGEPTGQPRSWVAEVRPPLEGHHVHEEAHGRPVLRSAVEHHTEVHPELGEVDAEHPRVVGIVRTASQQRR